jgi:hypothetical protein
LKNSGVLRLTEPRSGYYALALFLLWRHRTNFAGLLKP